ncbi:MAG TPA: hypothetical protein VGY53_05315 [Isosphaeraceae bacterium]|jgi:hypothetical protein|nr:hypothetical protein [Isosphaeraceae bacterium]
MSEDPEKLDPATETQATGNVWVLGAEAQYTSKASERPFGVANLLWLVAYAALLLSAVFTPAERPSLLSLVAAGHLLWAGAFYLDWSLEPKRHERPAGKAVVVGVLAAMGAGELIGMALGFREDDQFQAAWFGLALSFLVAALASSMRWPPSDFVLGCQIFFHVMMLAPALAILARAIVWLNVGDWALNSLGGAGPLAVVLVGIALVGFPFVLAAMGAALQISRAANTRSWSALLVHQAAFTIMVLRWVSTSH